MRLTPVGGGDVGACGDQRGLWSADAWRRGSRWPGAKLTAVRFRRGPHPRSRRECGLAAKYPGDVGIEKGYSDCRLRASRSRLGDEVCRHWEAATGKPIMSKSDVGAAGKAVGSSRASDPPCPAARNGVPGRRHLYADSRRARRLGLRQHLFFRFYMKFNRSMPRFTYGSGLIGFHPPTPWPQGAPGSGRGPMDPGRPRSSGQLHHLEQPEQGTSKVWWTTWWWPRSTSAP